MFRNICRRNTLIQLDMHIELYTDKCLPHNFKNYGAELKIMAPNLLIYF